ncbi:NAD(P)H-dependent oxidoreductase [Pseudoxanthomonas kalamensis]|uniref:NAD(P)H-dependent oxidoreductase n=1 Tax=Pseudoxanthomonas kalamensis TaxID=289483 RepID=UPI001391F6AE|nr:NAD(P)H-dependent oxidoreductase [Pseudoxanthomonas kalamensis]
MNVLIVHAYPKPRSFCSAMCEAVGGVSRQQEHDVVVADLYCQEFDAVAGDRVSWRGKVPNTSHALGLPGDERVALLERYRAYLGRIDQPPVPTMPDLARFDDRTRPLERDAVDASGVSIAGEQGIGRYLPVLPRLSST